ncbi:MAG: hypothetical protein R2802_12105 [Flavobacteriaceae bacterium]
MPDSALPAPTGEGTSCIPEQIGNAPIHLSLSCTSTITVVDPEQPKGFVSVTNKVTV